MTVKELREMNLLIRGYAMPDDNAPCFYKRCKLSEALEILTEYVTDFPEDFYNLCFDVFTEDDECLFSIRRDLKTVYTTRTNQFNLNKKLIRKALGIKMPNIWTDGIMGLVVGDALGVPVQFAKRVELKINPVKTMEGYGTYFMPPGTWSDDSSMTLATLDSIRERDGIDLPDIMDRFVGWLYDGEYTPAGEAFDQGITCEEAIRKYKEDKDCFHCGRTGEMANGNGALMRILPVCLFAYENVIRGDWKDEQAIKYIHQVSGLTHNHMRSKIACGMYYYMVKEVIEGSDSLLERLEEGLLFARIYYDRDEEYKEELKHYERIHYLRKFADFSEDEIKSTGYVVDSLEAAVWCLITTDTLEECLLKAVNLGDDTDTIAAIAGGLAGLYYGYASVPENWRKQIVKEKEILALCEIMEERYDVE